MKTHTIADVRRNGNFYKFPNYVPETWSGTLIDMLSVTNVPAEDRIWAVTGLLDDRTNRLFAIWNARTAIERYDHAPDPRSITACDVAERYANGQATADELAVAEDAAWWAAKEYASAHPDIIITSVESARLAAANATGAAIKIAAGTTAGVVARIAGNEQLAKLLEMISEAK